jgi:lysozyme family protein
VDFNSSLAVVLEFEGGYSNDPNDPGGETNLGISKRSYPNLDIASLTPEIVAPIYRSNYWDAIACDTLPEPLKLLAFNCAVNQGPGYSRELLAVTKDPVEFAQHCARRYMQNAEFSKYGAGWINRLLAMVYKTRGP